MAAETANGAVPKLAKMNAVGISLKRQRKRGSCHDGDEGPKFIPPAKRQRVIRTALQPRDSNVQGPRLFSSSSDELDSIPEFEYSESRITILEILETENDDVMMYRILAGGRTFALKVHKYTSGAISEAGIPKTNISFDTEYGAYCKLLPLRDSPLPLISKCLGYVRFSTPPQVNRPGSIARPLLRSTTYRPAVYTDFLMDWDGIDPQQDLLWRQYFTNASQGCILRGLVFEEVPEARHLNDKDRSNLIMAKSGLNGLKAFHKLGVLHGRVGKTYSALVSSSESGIIWTNFGAARIGGASFATNAAKEIDRWYAYLHSKKRAHYNLADREKQSFGVREEHRITLAMMEQIYQQWLQWDLYDAAEVDDEDCPAPEYSTWVGG
ncbi:hypothetical protein B7463_g8950, partial [Scytalidium lignicola]